ncbi:MAG: glycosyltransferase family 4 protein [Nitrosopumilus sp.]|uniref:glycosyltransferase family 4 protein n=1 Tax=Nitrosopumilus sp. TaxID=2024843 RepID=UPI00242A33D6|nr:glycosyltransferase family 4 protein [Nitrosopumilus sp.]MCV0366661.1 glycosyltransferase family 4 protein [Nitrosopumilus sp.]
MKILYISPRYEGGIGGHAFRVAEKLREQGHDVKLMKIPHIPIKKLKNPSFTVFGILKSLINQEKYDVVHAWNIPSAFIMKYVNSDKKILSVHGNYSEQIGILHSKTTGTLASKAELKAFQISNKLTTDSKTVQKYYKDKVNANFIYLPAPLDVNKFKNICKTEKKKNQVIYIGRNSYEKGIDILKQIESKINGNVVYCTNLPWEQTMEVLKSSNLLIVPSRMESIPQVIKEAFYLKIPVIATNVGGISEIVTDHETGILVPPEDPSKMLDAINSLLINEELQKKLTQNAYDFITNFFTWDVLLPKYLNLYSD